MDEHVTPTVLVVDDERAITDAYADWLREDYDVRTAYSGTEALERYDEDVDVVLLDRRMPDLSGREVLAEIADQGDRCWVALVSAVEPDFDILEMGFDTYIVKPVSDPEELRETVEMLLRRSEYDERIQDFLSLASKKATLEAKKSQAKLDGSDEYADLEARMLELRESLSDAATALDDEDLRAELQGHKS